MNTKAFNSSEGLSVLAVNVTATPYVWEQDKPSEWNIILPDVVSLTATDCAIILEIRDELEPVREWLSDSENYTLWQGAVSRSDQRHYEMFHPFVNVYYDLPITEDSPTPAEMQHMLRDLPVIVVELRGEIKLAITEELLDPPMFLCWAYTILGHLPPFSTIEVPDYSGGVSPYILNACQRTIAIVQNRCALKTEMIDRLLKLSHDASR